jgi:hypothetical protein
MTEGVHLRNCHPIFLPLRKVGEPFKINEDISVSKRGGRMKFTWGIRLDQEEALSLCRQCLK